MTFQSYWLQVCDFKAKSSIGILFNELYQRRVLGVVFCSSMSTLGQIAAILIIYTFFSNCFSQWLVELNVTEDRVVHWNCRYYLCHCIATFTMYMHIVQACASIQPSVWLPFLFIVSVNCTLLDDTSFTVHPVSVVNEENKHSKHTLPPIVSVITTDSTP